MPAALYILMTPGRVQEESLRLDRFGYSRLIWALGISLAFHLFCFGNYELGKKFNLWQALRLPEWTAEAQLEAGNDDALVGLVVHKRHGVSDPMRQWVSCTVADLVAILSGEKVDQ